MVKIRKSLILVRYINNSDKISKFDVKINEINMKRVIKIVKFK